MNEGKEYSVWSAGAIGAFNDKHRNKKAESIVERVMKMEKALETIVLYCKDRHAVGRERSRFRKESAKTKRKKPTKSFPAS